MFDLLINIIEKKRLTKIPQNISPLIINVDKD